MIIEIGHYGLILGLLLSGLQALFGLMAINPKKLGYSAYAEGLSLAATIGVIIAFAALLWAFSQSDFSVLNVVLNSHSDKPLFYKLSGAWGNHEGSMLLWCLIMVSFGAFVTLRGQDLPQRLKHLVLGVQGLLSTLFLGFTFFTSNPLTRVLPPAFQGNSLNPALQDPALAVHPPMLYIGYVGFSIVFSFAVASLIEGRIDKKWAQLVRPWVLMSWLFLTLGIGLGAFWAYYQLGWGGWWAWDPVENASLMPWLSATALLHSVLVMQKRGSLKGWTLLLALITFVFSMLGAFLVRSGILTSVHAFATDPSRGIVLLGIIMVTALLAFLLYGLRGHLLSEGESFDPVSRESALIINNLFISASLSVVAIGTLYPVFMESLFNQAVAVGPPYFNLIFGPIFMLAMAFLPVSLFLAWKKGNLGYGIRQVILSALIALVLGFGFASFYAPLTLGFQPSLALGLFMGLYVIFGSMKWLWERIKGGDSLHRLIHLEPSAKAMILAHIGLGLLVIGAVSDHHGRQITTKPMGVGESLSLGTATLSFTKLDKFEASNFDAQRGQFVISQGDQVLCKPQAQRRFFQHSSEIIGKVGLCFLPLSDYYVILGDPVASGDGKPRFQVRFLYNPLIRLVFLGVIFMVVAGLIAALGARFRSSSNQLSETQKAQ